MPEKMNVALLIQTATAWGYQLLEGVVRYAKKQEHWKILHEHGRGTREILRLPTEWNVDGIISGLHNLPMIEHVRERKVPVVNMSSIYFAESAAFPRVCEDIVCTGMMAANHFNDRGFKNFAYYGSFRNGLYASLRDAFEKTTKAKRGSFSCHPVSEQRLGVRKKSRDTVGLKEWLKSLPKPIGILTWKSRSAIELSDACHELGILIPEQVAILIVGAANDQTYEILEPSVSSVAVDAAEIGYRAAQLLDRMMQRKQQEKDGRVPWGGRSKKPKGPVLVPPAGIDLRESTDTLAIENEHVAQALFFIRHHALKPITVADVLQHVTISRPRIEILFRQYLNRSPAEEIRRLRLARAEELLRKTNLTIPEVAEAAGFTSAEYLARVFKTTKGVTPLRYRKG